MKRGRTEAETCRINGWSVGDVLEGDEGYGLERIVITAIGAKNILAHCVGKPELESIWTLTCREWRKVER